MRGEPDSDETHLRELLYCRDTARRALLDSLGSRQWTQLGTVVTILDRVDSLVAATRDRLGQAGQLADGVAVTWAELPDYDEQPTVEA